MSIRLDASVSVLKGVGESVAQKLQRLNIQTVEDLLTHYPRRYDDFSKITTIRAMRPGLITIRGTIERIDTRRTKARSITITEAVIADNTGTVKAVWFNQPYLKTQLPTGSEVFVSGRLEFRNNDLAIQSPAVESVEGMTKHTGRIVPVYPETSGLSSKQIRGLIQPLLPLIQDLPETLPEEVIKKSKLMNRSTALREVHFPSSEALLQQARYRIAFEELFFLILAGLAIKHDIQTEKAPVINFKPDSAKKFVKTLPFELTDAQRRASWEILQDLWREQPMNRLLEGDVGSGKTMVAAMAAFMSMENGFQVALMVPTEVLARQHTQNLQPLFERLGYRLQLITGKQSAADKREAESKVQSGEANLIIGTHSLLNTSLKFNNLGLVIIDEQHRFGVNQRVALKQKAGRLPHLLSMTATPIPRSLALTVYGDLDISIVDALPPGRSPIVTKVKAPSEREAVYAAIEKELTAGRQAFVICPLVEDSDKTGAKSVTGEVERLRKGPFKHRRVGVIHGKLTADEKQAVMAQMAAGELDILVATTVIEVGIDIPNASVILVEGAEKFGLATLHQIRGRVGRGVHKSYCYLLGESKAAGAQDRLKALEKTSDGFRLAQIDLELRGPGQIYGLQQHGILNLEMADITDTRLVSAVRKAAIEYIKIPERILSNSYVANRLNDLKAVTSLD